MATFNHLIGDWLKCLSCFCARPVPLAFHDKKKSRFYWKETKTQNVRVNVYASATSARLTRGRRAEFVVPVLSVWFSSSLEGCCRADTLLASPGLRNWQRGDSWSHGSEAGEQPNAESFVWKVNSVSSLPFGPAADLLVWHLHFSYAPNPFILLFSFSWS